MWHVTNILDCESLEDYDDKVIVGIFASSFAPLVVYSQDSSYSDPF